MFYKYVMNIYVYMFEYDSVTVMAVSKSCCVVLCVVLLAQMVFSAPGYSDYESKYTLS